MFLSVLSLALLGAVWVGFVLGSIFGCTSSSDVGHGVLGRWSTYLRALYVINVSHWNEGRLLATLSGNVDWPKVYNSLIAVGGLAVPMATTRLVSAMRDGVKSS